MMLLYLPLAHNFGRLMHLTGPYVGYTIAFLPDPLAVAGALLEIRPTILPSVPRVYEKVHTAVVAAFDETTGVKRRLVDWALRVGRRASALRQHGQPCRAGSALQLAVADRLVFVEDAASGSADGCGRRSPVARRSPRRSRSSSTRSGSGSSRATA